MRFPLPLFLFLWLPWCALAQTQPDCPKMLREGDALMARKDPPLEEALRCYLNALNCDAQLAGKIGPKLQGVFNAIKKQKENEQKVSRIAQERLLSIEKQSKEIQVKTLASRANSLMTEGRYFEAMQLADEANEMTPSGDMQALMMRAYEALQQPGAARLQNTVTTRLKISQLFYNHASGILIATDQEAGTSMLYRFSGHTVTETPLPGITKQVIFSPDNRRFVLINHKNSMTLWDSEGKKIRDLPVLLFNERCRFSFSPCSQYLLYGNNYSARLWTADGQMLIDGADSLRPVFTKAYFTPDLNDEIFYKASFFQQQGKTCIMTIGGANGDRTCWDVARLLQGYGLQSIVDQLEDGAGYSLGTTRPLPLFFNLAAVPGSLLKYLKILNDEFNGQYLGAIKRDRSIMAYVYDEQARILITATEAGEIARWQFNWSLGFEKQFQDKCLARFDPGSQRVLTLESPNLMHLLDPSGRELFEQPVYHEALRPVLDGQLFSPDGNILATSFGSVSSFYNLDGKLQHVAFRPLRFCGFQRENILFRTDSTLYQWSEDKRQTARVYRSNKALAQVQLSPLEDLAWLWLQDSTAAVLKGGKTSTVNLPATGLQGKFSPKGHYFIVDVSRDSSQALFTAGGQPLAFPASVAAFGFSPDERFLTVKYKNGAMELRAGAGEVVKRFPKNTTSMFSPGGRYLLLYQEAKGEIEWYDLLEKQTFPVLTEGNLLSWAFSPDDQYIALAFDRKRIELLSTAGGGVQIPEVGAVRFSPGGHYLLVQKNNEARIYSPDGVLIHHVERKTVTEFAFSPDDQWLLFSGFDGLVKLLPMPLGLHSFLE